MTEKEAMQVIKELEKKDWKFRLYMKLQPIRTFFHSFYYDRLFIIEAMEIEKEYLLEEEI